MKTSWATYAGLAARRHAISPDGGRMAIATGGFFQVMEKGEGAGMTGWKLHVSVAPKDVGAAWDVLYPFLEERGIALAKVAMPDTARKLGNPNHPQAGKMITVYADETPRPWAEIAACMEGILHDAGIRPGPEVAGEAKLFASRYTTFRNDLDAAGRYVKAEAKAIEKYEPSPFCGRRS